MRRTSSCRSRWCPAFEQNEGWGSRFCGSSCNTKLGQPPAAAVQAGGVSVQGTIYQATPTLVRWGADRLGLSMLPNGVAVISNAGARLLTGVGSRVGTIALAVGDGRLSKA